MRRRDLAAAGIGAAMLVDIGFSVVAVRAAPSGRAEARPVAAASQAHARQRPVRDLCGRLVAPHPNTRVPGPGGSRAPQATKRVPERSTPRCSGQRHGGRFNPYRPHVKRP